MLTLTLNKILIWSQFSGFKIALAQEEGSLHKEISNTQCWDQLSILFNVNVDTRSLSYISGILQLNIYPNSLIEERIWDNFGPTCALLERNIKLGIQGFSCMLSSKLAKPHAQINSSRSNQFIMTIAPNYNCRLFLMSIAEDSGIFHWIQGPINSVTYESTFYIYQNNDTLFNYYK